MATNINLTTPEISEKKSISGKPALIISLIILAAVFAIYGTLNFIKASYISQETTISGQILQEQNKVSQTDFVDVIDFERRLNLLDRAVVDHSYWDSLMKRMGSYVIPEVKFKDLSGKWSSDGSRHIEITGIAPNLDAASRELLLLRDFSDLDYLEFESIKESKSTEGQPGGLEWKVDLNMGQSAFRK